MTGGEIKRIGVLGGTFDPIHIGHLLAASEAMHAFALDRVLFVPTGMPWQKSEFSDPEHRYLMTVLGTAGHPGFGVSRMELDRRGPTYTADTMEELRGFHGEQTELYFIGGADAISRLGTWKGVERLATLAEVICVTRAGNDLTPASDPSWPKVHLLEIPTIDISSSQLRRRVRRAEPIDVLVPAPVAGYIREHGLYG